MVRCFLKRAGIDKKIELTDVEFYREKRVVSGMTPDNELVVVPVNDVIVEEVD